MEIDFKGSFERDIQNISGKGGVFMATIFRAVLIILFSFSASIAFGGQGSSNINVSPLPPNLSVSVKFTEPSGNNILDAGETGKLIVTIKNSGKGDAFDLEGSIVPTGSMDEVAFERNVSLGTVPAGEDITKEIEFRASEDISTADVKFTLNIKEANGFSPDPVSIAFKTKSFAPPQLVVADIGIDDQNGNLRIEPMEMVEVTARIQNIGHGDARGVAVDVKTGKNVFIAGDGVTHFEPGGIPSGRYRDIKFIFYTNKLIKHGERIPITLTMTEARPKFSNERALDLVMNAPHKRIEEIIVKGMEEQPKGEIGLATGLSVDVDMHIPEGQKAGMYDVAVIIGNKNYSASGSPDVDFADRDARIMKEYLVKTFGYDLRNIIYSEDAGFAKFNEIFGSERDHRGRLSNMVKNGVSKVFIYYAGHGAPDLETSEAYFVPVDANPQYIKTSGYRLQTFYNNLSKIPAKKITIVLDSCFSGSSEKGMLLKGISPAMVKVKKEYQGPSNAVIITSAAVDQVSAWYPEKRHSLFTYYFLKSLQGDADANKDRKITIGEMKEYLKENVPYMARRLSGIEQLPVIMGKDDDVVVVLKK